MAGGVRRVTLPPPDDPSFQRQLEIILREHERRLNFSEFETVPWVPKVVATVDDGGTHDGLSTVEAGATFTKVSFAFTSSDDSLYPLTSVSNLSDGESLSFDPGAHPTKAVKFTPASAVAAPKTYSMLLTSNKVSYQVKSIIREGFRVFYGSSANTSLTEAQIEALAGNTLDITPLGQWSVDSGSTVYKWFCYPKAWGTVSTFMNAATGATIAFNAPLEVSVTNAYSSTATYYAYRSTGTLDAAITLGVD